MRGVSGAQANRVMENANPFRTPGVALLVVGLLDIGIMIYCIVNKLAYSSSLNIFAVIAGILLIRGSVKTARYTRWFIAFLLTGLIGFLLVVPFITPFDLLLIHIKTAPTISFLFFILACVFLGTLFWVYRTLSSEPCLLALEQGGFSREKPKSAFMAGLLILVLLVGLTHILRNGEAANKAIELAKRKIDGDYKYFVSSISTRNKSGSATVKAYNGNEVHEIEVDW